MATTTETSYISYHVAALPEPIITTIADVMDLDEAAEPQVKQPHATPSFPFFDLPAELRTQIYEELLVSDASFRLGHHGPFCLVPRKPTWPAILQTSRRVLEEAAPVLYGANSFFLGTIGFKPIYSFSFFSSVGPINAGLIRKLVAHSTYPNLTTRSYLQKWIDSLGITFDRLKVLAISFETKPLEVTAMPPPGPAPIGVPLQMQIHHLPPANATLQSQNQTLHPLSANANILASAIGIGATAAMAVAVASNTTTTTTTTTPQNSMLGLAAPPNAMWSAANAMVSSVLATQNWPALPSTVVSVPAPVLASASTGHTPNASVSTAGAGAATASGPVAISVREDDGQYEMCARREQLWLQKASMGMVQEFANVANCDLRVGECWLMYRDVNVRKLPGAR